MCECAVTTPSAHRSRPSWRQWPKHTPGSSFPTCLSLAWVYCVTIAWQYIHAIHSQRWKKWKSTHQFLSQELLMWETNVSLKATWRNWKSHHTWWQNMLVKMCLRVSGSAFLCAYRCTRNIYMYFSGEILGTDISSLSLSRKKFWKLGHEQFKVFSSNSAVISQTRCGVATDESRAEHRWIWLNQNQARSRVEQTPASTSQHPTWKEPGSAALTDGFKNGILSVKQKMLKAVRENIVATRPMHQKVFMPLSCSDIW